MVMNLTYAIYVLAWLDHIGILAYWQIDELLLRLSNSKQSKYKNKSKLHFEQKGEEENGLSSALSKVCRL